MEFLSRFRELTGPNYCTLIISELCHVDYFLTWNPKDGPFGIVSIQAVEIIGNLYQISDQFYATDKNFRDQLSKYIEDNVQDYGIFNDQIYKFISDAKIHGKNYHNNELWFFEFHGIELTE